MAAADAEVQSILERQQTSTKASTTATEEVTSNSVDVFDQDDFDATSYINEMFPTGCSFRGPAACLSRI